MRSRLVKKLIRFYIFTNNLSYVLSKLLIILITHIFNLLERSKVRVVLYQQSRCFNELSKGILLEAVLSDYADRDAAGNLTPVELKVLVGNAPRDLKLGKLPAHSNVVRHTALTGAREPVRG